MNDNKDKLTGMQLVMPAHVRIDPRLFDVLRYVADFKTLHVRERRLARGQGRQVLILLADAESFLHVAARRFVFQT